MKNKYYIATLSATVLTCAMAHAGDTLATAPTASSPTSGFSPYLGVSGVYNEWSLPALLGGSEDTTGYKVEGGVALAHGFSINGSFEETFGSVSLGGLASADFSFTDTRVIVNYTHELEQGFSLVGGLGYGYLGLDLQAVTASSEGLMAEAGIKYRSGQFFGGLQYNHLFSMHTSSLLNLADVVLGALSPGSPFPDLSVPGEDVGAIEAYVGYQFNENVAATLSVETQVVGDSALEKDLGVALGLQYSF
jgi:hypothetical protein